MIKWRVGYQRPVLRTMAGRFGKSAVLFPAATLCATAIGTINLGLIFYLKDVFDATPGTIGLIAAVWSLTYFIGCFLFRPLTRALLPRHSLILSSFLNMTFILLILVTRRIEIVAVLYGLFGLSLSLFWPPLMGWISSGLEGIELNKEISRFNFSWSSGVVISPYLAGFLTERGNTLPLLVGPALMFSVCILIGAASIFLHNMRTDTHKEPQKSLKSAPADGSTALRFPSWISIVAAYAVLGVILVVFPLYGRDHLGLSASLIGVVLLVRGLANTIGFVSLGKTTAWHFKIVPIVAAPLLIACCLVALTTASTFAAYIAIVPVIGLLAAFSYAASVFHGVSGSRERGKRMAIHESLLTGGMVVGSAFGGLLYDHFDIQLVYLVFIGVLILGALAASIFYIMNKKAAARIEQS
jgi:predicted MFS family arabinose efflux permease